MSANSLAKAANMREPYLLAIEDGSVDHVHPRTLQKIADALDVHLDDLLKDRPQPTDDVFDELSGLHRGIARIIILSALFLGATIIITIIFVLAALLLEALVNHGLLRL